MNPSAPSYVPSFGIGRGRRSERPVSTPSTTPPSRAAAGPWGLSAGSLTAAARLRLLHPRPDPSLGGASHATSSATTPAMSASATPSLRVPGAATPASSAAPGAQPQPQPSPALTPAPLPPSRPLPIRYTRAELLARREGALEAVRHGPIVDVPPFTRLPASFAPLLALPFALEFVNVDAASALVEGVPRPYTGGFTVTAGDALPRGTAVGPAPLTLQEIQERLHLFHCGECAQGGPRPCEALATVLYNAKRYAMSQPLGRCLLQAPGVVWGQLQLALVFEAKQSSLRLRTLAERAPSIRRLVGEYLYGEGYHLPLPAVTAHEEWRAAMQMMRFDAIRDNRTRVITDLSKHWKKRHTQFEQFVFFFSYRDDVPIAGVKNMITRSVKPGMVAMLSGDVVAMILLHNLGFFIPPDYYWGVFPFLEQALGHDSMTYDVVRHLGGYLSARQDPNMYNPVTDPFTTYRQA